MNITRTDPVTGEENTLDIPVSEEQLQRWHDGHGLIQNIMPNLTDDEREFIMTGITADSWDEIFKDSETAEHGTDINDEEERPF